MRPFINIFTYMRLLSPSAGLVEQRGAPLSLPRSDRSPPLLSLPLPFHQDALGSDFNPEQFWAFHEALVGEIWDYQHSERRGRWYRVP